MLLSSWAWLALPGAVLVCLSFSSITLCLSSFVKKIQDFDLVMGLFVMPMFLFSGVFVPVTRFPAQIQWIIKAAPLYHGTAMLRQLTTGTVDAGIFIHIAYLVTVGASAFTLAMLRLERALVK